MKYNYFHAKLFFCLNASFLPLRIWGRLVDTAKVLNHVRGVPISLRNRMPSHLVLAATSVMYPKRFPFSLPFLFLFFLIPFLLSFFLFFYLFFFFLFIISFFFFSFHFFVHLPLSFSHPVWIGFRVPTSSQFHFLIRMGWDSQDTSYLARMPNLRHSSWMLTRSTKKKTKVYPCSL